MSQESDTKMLTDISYIGKKRAAFTRPDEMDAAQYGDLEYWLTGILRKAKRSVTDPDNLPKDGN